MRKITTWGLMKMKLTTLRNNILPLVINTNSWRITSMLWRFNIPGLDFEELGLVSRVVIPPKFKIPTFSKYDGVSCPKMHLRSYVCEIQPYTADRKLWIHFFQESLASTQLEWFYQLEGTNIHTWRTWLLLSTDSTNIMPTSLQPVHNCKVCLWVRRGFQRLRPEIEGSCRESPASSV